jgi:hypothetical protein
MEPLEPPIQSNTKAGHGFHHPVLSKMLCPGLNQKKLVDGSEYVTVSHLVFDIIYI